VWQITLLTCSPTFDSPVFLLRIGKPVSGRHFPVCKMHLELDTRRVKNLLRTAKLYTRSPRQQRTKRNTERTATRRLTILRILQVIQGKSFQSRTLRRTWSSAAWRSRVVSDYFLRRGMERRQRRVRHQEEELQSRSRLIEPMQGRGIRQWLVKNAT